MTLKVQSPSDLVSNSNATIADAMRLTLRCMAVKAAALADLQRQAEKLRTAIADCDTDRAALVAELAEVQATIGLAREWDSVRGRLVP